MTLIPTADLLALKAYHRNEGRYINEASAVGDKDTAEYCAKALASADAIDEILATRALLEQAEAALEKAANRLDWCAGLIVDDTARDKTGPWADDARTTLAALRQHREAMS